MDMDQVENKKITVTLIRTKNCLACEIMTNILTDVITDYVNNSAISFIITDKNNFDKGILKYHNITDFPAIIIGDDNNIMCKFIGTVTYKMIVDEIEKAI